MCVVGGRGKGWEGRGGERREAEVEGEGRGGGGEGMGGEGWGFRLPKNKFYIIEKFGNFCQEINRICSLSGACRGSFGLIIFTGSISSGRFGLCCATCASTFSHIRSSWFLGIVSSLRSLNVLP